MENWINGLKQTGSMYVCMEDHKEIKPRKCATNNLRR